MNEQWKNIIITKISVAVYVAPNTGKHIHKDRPYHGLVLNDSDSVKDYVFDDGRIMRTDENALFYLPKGSSYHVESHQIGGCYAINFDAEIEDEPFSILLQNDQTVKKEFKTACKAWNTQDPLRYASAMHALYGCIYQLCKEQKRNYMPSKKRALISPALLEIESSLSDNDLSISHLSSLCGISEVYFRKIFVHRFGVSPKEYMINKKMEYATQLLASNQLKVSDVARLCGYTEPCHFSREFKKRFGITPKDFR